MSKLNKSEVANWIRSLVLTCIHPNWIAPKGSGFNPESESGKVYFYDAVLMPRGPEMVDRTVTLDSLINLYSLAEDE